jgi:predicted DNA-binding transcriptional regulator AlpA
MAMKHTPYTGRRYLRRQTVAERYDVNVQTVDNMVKAGRLPRPYYHGGIRSPRWAEDELDEFDRTTQRERKRSEAELAADRKRRKQRKAGEAAATP